MNKATAYSSLSIKSVGPLYFEHRSELILLNVLHWDQLVWMTGLKKDVDVIITHEGLPVWQRIPEPLVG